jgi:hypothetical protein
MIVKTHMNKFIAAFLVAFFYLVCSASAYEYVQCPDSAQIDNAYWNYPQVCAGGVYPDGSLHLKWPDAPFTNDTVEVQSVSLNLRASSIGTYLIIQAWNGRSWSHIYGGQVDFLGDYKFDLTYLPGPYLDGTARVKVFNSGREELKIEELTLAVEYESNLNDLTVVVRDCESNKRLEDVEVEVSDYGTKIGEQETNDDGEAVFTLTKDRFYEIEAGGEDYYEKYTGAYLDEDMEVEVCVYKYERAGVEVRDLDVEDGVIEFYIENTGNYEETIQYTVTVDDYAIFDGYVTLDVDEDERITGSYDFEPGIHKVKARAEVGGYADSDWTTHSVAGDTENYRCSGNNVVRERITSGGFSSWEVVEYCSETCSEGVCVSYGEYYDQTGDTCPIEITGVDYAYADDVGASEIQTFSVRVLNDDDVTRTVQLKLYVDGQLKDQEGLVIGSGRTATNDLQFRMAAGLRLVRIDAVACGYVTDSVSELINVKRVTTTYQSTGQDDDTTGPDGGPDGPGETPEPDTDEPTPQPSVLSIQVFPSEVVKDPCKGTAFKVTVSSPVDRVYDVQVTGIDEENVDYPSTVEVLRNKDFYVFVKAPEEAGVYPITIIVSHGEESVETVVKLTVSGNGAAPAGDSGEGDTGYDALTGFVTLAQSELVLYILIAIIIAGIFVVLIKRFYFSESSYDFAKLEEYDQSVRRASIE